MEENLEGSSGREDNQHDEKHKEDEEAADDQTEDTATDQSSQRQYSQTQHIKDVSRDSQSSQKTGQRNSEQMSSGTSRQVDGVEPGEFSHQMSAQLEENPRQSRSLETEERRASKQSDSPLPSQISYDISKRRKSMVDQRTAEQMRRLSGLVQPKPQQEIDSGLFDQIGGETLANTLSKTYEQETEIAADQVDHPDFSEQDTESIIPKRENYPEELDSIYKRLYSLRNKSFASPGDEKAEEDSIYTSCKFEPSQIKEKISQTSVSAESDTESLPNLQSFTLFDPHNTSILQVKDESLNGTLPSTSSTLDYMRSKEKPQNDEYINDEMSFFRRRFPSLLYEDPYEVSVRYMEKHNILRIFQITENLVYEKPEDPLSFMLSQIQQMMQNRSTSQTAK